MASSCNCPITLKERKKKQTNKRTTNKQTNKNKTICASQSLLQPGCCLMSGTKLHKAQSLKFFFFYSETFSLVLMQKTCFYFCYDVTMRSFSNRESRDQSSSGLHTQFLLIIINNLLILCSCHFTGSGRTYQLFLL